MAQAYMFEDWRPRNTSIIYDGSMGRIDPEHSLTSYTFDGILYRIGYFGKEITERMLYRAAQEWHKESTDGLPTTGRTTGHHNGAGTDS